jgi:hypothetical protein
MPRCPYAPVVGLVLVIALTAGCDSGPRRLPASGAVTYRGQPVPEGFILFQPQDPGRGQTTGTVVSNGRYALPAAEGLSPGRYTVRITAADPARRAAATPRMGADGIPVADGTAREWLPPRYNTQSSLEIDAAPGGPTTFDFNLD